MWAHQRLDYHLKYSTNFFHCFTVKLGDIEMESSKIGLYSAIFDSFNSNSFTRKPVDTEVDPSKIGLQS